MKYLLDVNTLTALKQSCSPHHQTCRNWADKHGMNSMATCTLAELGFIQVSMLTFGVSLADPQSDLPDLKGNVGQFVEQAPLPSLPAWANNTGNTTDAYLIQLAQSAGLQLATFDK